MFASSDKRMCIDDKAFLCGREHEHFFCNKKLNKVVVCLNALLKDLFFNVEGMRLCFWIVVTKNCAL